MEYKNVKLRMRIEMQKPVVVFNYLAPLIFSLGSSAPNISNFYIRLIVMPYRVLPPSMKVAMMI